VSEKQIAPTIRVLQSKKSSLAASHTTKTPKTKHAEAHKVQIYVPWSSQQSLHTNYFSGYDVENLQL
jgi:hypothetical protein